jgi:hypothetical protein
MTSEKLAPWKKGKASRLFNTGLEKEKLNPNEFDTALR